MRRIVDFTAWAAQSVAAGEGVAGRDIRLRLLDRAIEENPQAAVNFVLRGEYRLSQGDLDGARNDFEQALFLARLELSKSDWGYILQSLLDRAEQGLRLADEIR
jgi:hypothetical protein